MGAYWARMSSLLEYLSAKWRKTKRLDIIIQGALQFLPKKLINHQNSRKQEKNPSPFFELHKKQEASSVCSKHSVVGADKIKKWLLSSTKGADNEIEAGLNKWWIKFEGYPGKARRRWEDYRNAVRVEES